VLSYLRNVLFIYITLLVISYASHLSTYSLYQPLPGFSLNLTFSDSILTESDRRSWLSSQIPSKDQPGQEGDQEHVLYEIDMTH